jgi:hypothetical protein
MKKLLLAGIAAISLSAPLAACTTTEQGATVGAVTGGVVGGAVTGSPVGAVVGAGVGAVAGAAIGKVADQPGQCYYRNSRGRVYIAPC